MININKFKRFIRIFFRYTSPVKWEVGDYVVDDLTLTVSKIEGIEWAEGKVRDKDNKPIKYIGCCAIWLDNDHLDGGRHPWEISEPLKLEEIPKWKHDLNIYRTNLEKKLSLKQQKT